MTSEELLAGLSTMPSSSQMTSPSKTPGLFDRLLEGREAGSLPFGISEETGQHILEASKPFKTAGEALYGATNTMAFGAPGFLARKAGIKTPSSRAEKLGSVAGLFGFGGVRKLGKRVFQETVGHAKGAAALRTVGSRAKFAERVGGIADTTREGLSKRFGQAIDRASEAQALDPSKLLDLQEVGRTLQPVKSFLSPGMKRAGSDIVSLLVEEPSIGTGIGLMEARAIKAAIQRSPEINRATEAGRILRQARDLVRHEEVTKLGLGEQFKEFKSGMDAFRQANPLVEKIGIRSPVTSGLKSLTEAEIPRKALERLSDISGQRGKFAEVLGAARTAGIQRGVGTFAKAAVWPLAAGAGLYAAGRKLFSHMAPPQ